MALWQMRRIALICRLEHLMESDQKVFSSQIGRYSQSSPGLIFEKRKQSQSTSSPELSYGPEPEANARGISSLPSRKGFSRPAFYRFAGLKWRGLGFFSGSRRNRCRAETWFFIWLENGPQMEGIFFWRVIFPILETISSPCPALILIFSGEAEGYGVMFNLGASFDLSSSASVFFGAGAGPFSQEFEFKLLGEGFDEEHGVLATNCSPGSTSIHPSICCSVCDTGG